MGPRGAPPVGCGARAELWRAWDGLQGRGGSGLVAGWEMWRMPGCEDVVGGQATSGWPQERAVLALGVREVRE